MVGSHYHCERCRIVRCDMLRRIQSAIRNWAKDKRNEAVLEQANNQALTTRPI
jgi:hypothetical protein